MEIQATKRKHKRYELNIPIKYITPQGVEVVSSAINISRGGLLIAGTPAVEEGNSIPIFLEGLGQLSGTIVRKSYNTFAVRHFLTDSQRSNFERYSDGLPIFEISYSNTHENRAQKRRPLSQKQPTLVTSDSQNYRCYIKDISETGLAFRSPRKPAIEKFVRIGFLYGIVCRHMDDGFAIKLIARHEVT